MIYIPKANIAQRIYPYPIEVATNWYATQVGGFSPDLAENCIGIDENALMEAGINPCKEVKIVGCGRPFFLSRRFYVLPLNHDDFVDPVSLDTRYSMSKGEIVFPLDYGENKKLKVGDMVILNATTSRVDEGKLYDVITKVLCNPDAGTRHKYTS